MRKPFLTFLLVLLVSTTALWASDTSVDGIWYDFNNSTLNASVTYNSNGKYTGDVTIPSSISYNGGTYSVTSIGDNAFYGCSSLTSVTIPESVTSIGDEAFYGCSGLTSVTMPNSVTSIGGYAFYRCSGLSSVTIPESVTSIGTSAFYSVANIVYSGIATGSPWGAKSVNGYVDGYLVYSDETKNTLLACSGSATGEITIPNSVTSIGGYAFYDCSGLTSVTMPNSVTSIGGYAFYGCSGLTNITIPESVTSIKNSAFSGCSGLTSVTIPNSVTSIGDGAFSGCSGLTSVTLPESITSIGDYAFYRCSGLTSVTIPNSVTSIGIFAFSRCSSLTSVIWNAKNCVTSDTYYESPFYSYYDPSQITSFVLGDEVESLPAYLFYGMDYLETIIVPCQDAGRFMDMLNYSSRITRNGNPIDYSHLITLLSDSIKGNIEIAFEPYDCDSLITVSAIPNEGYSFLKWNDGNTNAQRKIKLTEENQTFAAIFSQDATSLSYLATGGSWLGEMTTDNTDVWRYNSSYGAYGSRSGGVTGNLFTPAKDMRKAASVKLSFQHAHKFAGTPSSEFTLWVTKDFKGSWDESEWHQLTISPYTSNTNWTFSSVTINVPVKYVGKGTVFAFKYQSTSSNFGTWEIKNLNINITWSEKYLIADETDPAQGFIVGAGLHDYLATAELTATPQYGYHFTQWSDGDTINPRTIVIASDTIFVAEFAADKSGTCGDDNLLTWEYDDQAMILTISGEGTLNSNYTYGVEAPEQAEKLVLNNGVTSIGDEAFRNFTSLTSLTIPNCVTSIGTSAFSGCSGLTNVTIPNSVTSIGEEAFCNCQNIDTLSLGENIASYGDKAFAGCPNITAIYNYRQRPARLGTETFKDVDYFNCILYVLAGSVNMYKSSGSDWKDFYFIEPIGAAEVTTDDVTVVPHDNTADITWPKVAQAETYEIQITKDSEVICVLVFNAQGQLVSIALAPSRHNVAEQAQTDGFSFTVTSLDSSTDYDLTITAKDNQGEVLQTVTQSFTTTGDVETATESVESSAMQGVSKVLRNGQLFITLHDGSKYSATGVKVE